MAGDDEDEGSVADCTGTTNFAMFRLWQNLSDTSSSATQILNLIWTDIAAISVVGTRGLQPGGNSSSNTIRGLNVEVPLNGQKIRIGLDIVVLTVELLAI